MDRGPWMKRGWERMGGMHVGWALIWTACERERMYGFVSIILVSTRVLRYVKVRHFYCVFNTSYTSYKEKLLHAGASIKMKT